MIEISEIKKLASELYDEVVEMRRHIHKYPELSFEEEKTAEFISGILDKYGIKHNTKVAGHGIVAFIHGQSDRVVALRADIDALPIDEKNVTTYKSIHRGVMHACGHDVHSSSLLGTAIILSRLKDRLPHSLKIFFQPAEEKLPGGAKLMIEEGVLENPKPESIIGQHVYPELETGKVGIRSGLYMASSDEIYITVTGKGGHGAMPDKCTDTVLATAHMIVALQQIVSRKTPTRIPTVLSLGKINSTGGATNVISDEVKIEGTFRTMNEEWRKKAHSLIIQIAEDTCRAFGANVEVNILNGYPCLINDAEVSHKVKSAMIDYLGNDNVVDLDQRMTSEDFAYYSQEMPACFYRLGTANAAKGITSPVHTSTFDVDESALEIGMGLMAWIALNL